MSHVSPSTRERIMTDTKGKIVRVGDRVRFNPHLSDEWFEGTVRGIRETSYYNEFEQRIDVTEALVDNGNPGNSDANTNGFTCAAWVDSERIKILEGS